MHVAKDHIPVKISAPGAVARQLPDFGIAEGAIGAEYFTLAAGTDLAPLLAGLDGDSCHAAHWGYVLTGDVIITYRDGTTEACTTGDLFHWPPGHSVRIEHTAVIDHILGKARHHLKADLRRTASPNQPHRTLDRSAQARGEGAHLTDRVVATVPHAFGQRFRTSPSRCSCPTTRQAATSRITTGISRFTATDP